MKNVMMAILIMEMDVHNNALLKKIGNVDKIFVNTMMPIVYHKLSYFLNHQEISINLIGLVRLYLIIKWK